MNPGSYLETPGSFAFLLAEHYERLQLPLPELMPVEPEAIPQPQRRLLVHDCDLTPTLEAEYGRRIHIRALRYAVADNIVTRLVALLLDRVAEPVSMGAIRIHLERLPASARRMIAQRREAFGTILRKTGVPHYSHPVIYFQAAPDAVMSSVLGAGAAGILYGRRNTIFDAADAPLAEVIEILPSHHPLNTEI